LGLELVDEPVLVVLLQATNTINTAAIAARLRVTKVFFTGIEQLVTLKNV